MQKFVSYLRVSTTRQGVSGLGLDAQRQSVATYLAGNSGELLEEFVEVESGAKYRRPILDAALEACRRNKAVLVIAKLDRLARNVAFISQLMETRVEFVACDAPYANRLMLHILSAFAEHEREQVSVRTKAALAAAKARGVKLGKNGPALARQNKNAAIEFAQSLRSEFESLFSSRNRTYTSAAEELNRRDVRTREGARWTATQVSRVLNYLKL
ncbi:recombinase family protein [Aurantiacibacter zhengii]|uniref:Recombinase family protein n=1 Tax=Aurantiacibacter zhengii TaxID=2307003 RepID=A0A418NQ48_9SPHN|nr:recombinase family protein [Aurantiacibacter zhengii]RIV84676.1 recombinase family protein [Aurantiacibacter zhengii]